MSESKSHPVGDHHADYDEDSDQVPKTTVVNELSGSVPVPPAAAAARWPMLHDAAPAPPARVAAERPGDCGAGPEAVTAPEPPPADMVRFLFVSGGPRRASMGLWPPWPPSRANRIHVNAAGSWTTLACRLRDRVEVIDVGSSWLGLASLCALCAQARPEVAALTM